MLNILDDRVLDNHRGDCIGDFCREERDDERRTSRKQDMARTGTGRSYRLTWHRLEVR